MKPLTNKSASKSSIKQMNSFLRGEIAAVETYEKAIEQYPTLQIQLADNLQSHRRRVDKLREHIHSCGETPDEDSGAWGAFAKTLQTISGKISEERAVSVLQEGEEHGTNDYKSDYEDLDPCCCDFTRDCLLKEQQKTQQTIDAVIAAKKS